MDARSRGVGRRDDALPSGGDQILSGEGDLEKRDGSGATEASRSEPVVLRRWQRPAHSNGSTKPAPGGNELPPQQPDGVLEKTSPPNVLIGGPVPVSPGFPIEAFGNDRLQEVW